MSRVGGGDIETCEEFFLKEVRREAKIKGG